jgi:hypothetical protein
LHPRPPIAASPSASARPPSRSIISSSHHEPSAPLKAWRRSARSPARRDPDR